MLPHTAPLRQTCEQTAQREHHAAPASISEDHLRGIPWGGWGSALGKCPRAMLPAVAKPVVTETALPTDASLSPADSQGLDCLLSPCVMDAASGMLIWRDLREAPYEDVRCAHDAAAATLSTWRRAAPPRVVALLLAPPPVALTPVAALFDALALRSERGPEAGHAEMVDEVPIPTAPAEMAPQDIWDRHGLAPCDTTTWETARARSGPDAVVCRLAVIVGDTVGQSLRLLPLHSAFPETTAALVATWGSRLEDFVAEVVSLGAGDTPPIATSLVLEESGGARQTIQVHHIALVAFQQRTAGRVGVLSSAGPAASEHCSSLNAVVVARITYSSASDSVNRARLSRAQDASEYSAVVLVKAQALVALLEHSGQPVVAVVSHAGDQQPPGIAGSKRARRHVVPSFDDLLRPVVQATSPLGLARIALCDAEADLKRTAIAVASLLALVPVRSALVSLSCLADVPRLVPLLLLALTRRDDRRGQASRMELEQVPVLGPVAENARHEIALPKMTCADLFRDGIMSLPEHSHSSDMSALRSDASAGTIEAAWSLRPNPAGALSCASIVTVNQPTSGLVLLDQGCGAPRVRPAAIAAAAARLAFADVTGVSNRVMFWCDSRSLTALYAGLSQCLPTLDALPITFPTRVLSGGGSSLLADVNSAVHLSALGIFGGSTVDAVAEGAAAASLADEAMAAAVHATHIAELAAVEVTLAEKMYADAQTLVFGAVDPRAALDVSATLPELPEAADAPVSGAKAPPSSENDAAASMQETAPGYGQLSAGVISDSASAEQAREVLQSSFVQSVVALLARNVVAEAAMHASQYATSAHKRATDLARIAPLPPPGLSRSQRHLEATASRPVRISAVCPTEPLLPPPQPEPLIEYPQVTLASAERDVLLQWIIDHRMNPHPSKGM